MNITELNVLFPIRATIDNDAFILFVDLVFGKVYLSSGEEVSEEIRNLVLSDMTEQQNLVSVASPVNVVQDLLKSKKSIMEGTNGGSKN